MDKNRVEIVKKISSCLLKVKPTSEYKNELKVLGFYFRMANLNKFLIDYKRLLGVSAANYVFQVAPSNTPITALYVALFGFLSGVTIYTRISDKSLGFFNELENVLDALDPKTKQTLQNDINWCTYPSSQKQTTVELTKLADVRLLWGSDKTVNSISSLICRPRNYDIYFPDKVSMAIICAKYITKADEDTTSMYQNNFYNDIVSFDQLACSSPRILVWIGSKQECEDAQDNFWAKNGSNKGKHGFAELVDQQISFSKIGFQGSYIFKNKWRGINIFEKTEKVQKVDFNFFQNRNLLQVRVDSLNGIAELVSEKLQTIAYCGFESESLKDWLFQNRMVGVDRIVSIGKSLDFSETWDGVCFFECFTKKIDIQ